MDVFRGYQVKQKKGISHWEPLLEEWLVAIERFCRVSKGEDAPYWYNERANIGVLAGAAWRCGQIALEEFQYEKGYKNKPKWTGRADLWLASEGHEDLIEAKFSWASLRSKRDMKTIVDMAIEEAMTDAKKSKGGNEFLKSIGVLFLPFYTKEKDTEVINDLIENAISGLKKSNYHALAWCFPKETRDYVSAKGNILPGVALIARNTDII